MYSVSTKKANYFLAQHLQTITKRSEMQSALYLCYVVGNMHSLCVYDRYCTVM